MLPRSRRPRPRRDRRRARLGPRLTRDTGGCLPRGCHPTVTPAVARPHDPRQRRIPHDLPLRRDRWKVRGIGGCSGVRAGLWARRRLLVPCHRGGGARGTCWSGGTGWPIGPRAGRRPRAGNTSSSRRRARTTRRGRGRGPAGPLEADLATLTTRQEERAAAQGSAEAATAALADLRAQLSASSADLREHRTVGHVAGMPGGGGRGAEPGLRATRTAWRRPCARSRARARRRGPSCDRRRRCAGGRRRRGGAPGRRVRGCAAEPSRPRGSPAAVELEGRPWPSRSTVHRRASTQRRSPLGACGGACCRAARTSAAAPACAGRGAGGGPRDRCAGRQPLPGAKADLADTRARLAEVRADLASEQGALTLAWRRAELTQEHRPGPRRHRGRGSRPDLARGGHRQHARRGAVVEEDQAETGAARCSSPRTRTDARLLLGGLRCGRGQPAR